MDQNTKMDPKNVRDVYISLVRSFPFKAVVLPKSIEKLLMQETRCSKILSGVGSILNSCNMYSRCLGSIQVYFVICCMKFISAAVLEVLSLSLLFNLHFHIKV